MPLRGEPGNSRDAGFDLPFMFADYLELVDWTGRAIRADDRGFIPASPPPILERLTIPQDAWVDAMRHYPVRFRRVVGPMEKVQQLCAQLEQRWLWRSRTALYPKLRPT